MFPKISSTEERFFLFLCDFLRALQTCASCFHWNLLMQNQHCLCCVFFCVSCSWRMSVIFWAARAAVCGREPHLWWSVQHCYRVCSPWRRVNTSTQHRACTNYWSRYCYRSTQSNLNRSECKCRNKWPQTTICDALMQKFWPVTVLRRF